MRSKISLVLIVSVVLLYMLLQGYVFWFMTGPDLEEAKKFALDMDYILAILGIFCLAVII